MEPTWWRQPSQLDASQQKVVSLPAKGDHLITGPPGSGKTNLLILRAIFLHKLQQYDTVILTYGRVLREFLATGSDNYDFSEDKIQTFVRWGYATLENYGVKIEDTVGFEQAKASITAELQKIVESGQPVEKHDCILIDEVQDYTLQEIDIIRHFAKQIFAVGDERQRIFESAGAIDHLKKHCTFSELEYHYRNGIKICRVADGIADLLNAEEGLEAGCQYNEAIYPSSVKSFSNLAIEDQVAVAVPEIITQLRAYPDGVIGVLCPRHNEIEIVRKALMASPLAGHLQHQSFESGYAPFDPDRRVILTTLHSAKGLEFRAVHLLGLDLIKKFRAAQKKMSYTAVTRAKTSLSIYHEAPLPGYLENGIGANSTASIIPKLDDLFPASTL